MPTLRELLPKGSLLHQSDQHERTVAVRDFYNAIQSAAGSKLSEQERQFVPGVVLGLLLFVSHQSNPVQDRLHALKGLEGLIRMEGLGRESETAVLCKLHLRQVATTADEDRDIVEVANSALKLLVTESKTTPANRGIRGERATRDHFEQFVQTQESRIRSFQISELKSVEALLEWLSGKSFSEKELKEVLHRLQCLLRDCGLQLIYNNQAAVLYPRPEGRKTGKFVIQQGKKRKHTTVFPHFSCQFLNQDSGAISAPLTE